MHSDDTRIAGSPQTIPTTTETNFVASAALSLPGQNAPAEWPDGYGVNIVGGGSPGSSRHQCRLYCWNMPPGSAVSYVHVGEYWGDDPIEALARALLAAWDHALEQSRQHATAAVTADEPKSLSSGRKAVQ